MTQEYQSDRRIKSGLRGRYLWHALLLLIAIGAVFAYRMANGRHYGRLIVRLDDVTASNQSLVIFAQRLDGSLLALQPRPENRQIWCRDSGWPPVKSVIVAGNDVWQSGAGNVEVLLGSSPLHAQTLRLASAIQAAPSEPRYREFRRRMGVQDAWEFIPEAAYLSPLSSGSGAVNWLGNSSLLLVAVTQGFGVWLAIVLLTLAMRRTAELYAVCQLSASPGLTAGHVAVELIRLILLIFTAHLCWCRLIPVMTLRVPDQVSAAMIAAILTGLMVAGWVRLVYSTSDFRLKVGMATFAVAVFLAKLWWLTTVEFRPLSDYEAFHRYGVQLAAGDWESIRNGPQGLSAIYLRRAAAFAWPISYFWGSSISAYESVNVLTQAVTVWLLCILIRRMFCLKTAALSLPFLLLYPEHWYLPGMVTHNIPGYLWMVAAWLAVESFLRVSGRQSDRGSRWLSRLGAASICGLLAGFALGMLDLTKSYGLIFIFSLALCLFSGPLLPASVVVRRTGAGPSILQRLVFFVVLVFTEQLMVRNVDQYLLQKSGLVGPPNWTLNYITAIDSTTDANGDKSFLWTHYAYAVDSKNVLPLAFRKLVHEKLGTGIEFLMCMFRKNEVLSRAADSMPLVQDNIRLPKLDAKPENVWFGAFQSTFSYLLALITGGMFLLRLLLPGPLLRSESELFPLVSSATVMMAVYLLTESHPYYALNLVFPFCWSAGSVIEKLRSGGGVAVSVTQAIRLYCPLPRCLAAGLLTIAVAVFCAAGSAVDHSGLTFHRVAATGSVKYGDDVPAASGEKAANFAATGTSRVHAWLELSTAAGALKAGQSAAATFTVQSEAGPLRGLRFFVAGNQRARNQQIRNAWKGLPIRYAITINGKTVLEDRPLDELARPRFVLVPASEWLGKQRPTEPSASVIVTLTCTADTSIGRIAPPPAISIEYFH
ncbi:MAG: hypothetical protein ACKOEO_22360 [Planctomycetaceae bacterium]